VALYGVSGVAVLLALYMIVLAFDLLQIPSPARTRSKKKSLIPTPAAQTQKLNATNSRSQIFQHRSQNPHHFYDAVLMIVLINKISKNGESGCFGSISSSSLHSPNRRG
jgi:hypothetical protein